MNLERKQELLGLFLLDWQVKFHTVTCLLRNLAADPNFNTDFINKSLVLDDGDLYDNQMEWIAHFHQLNNPADCSFFKSFWVPIVKDSIEYFMDLSSETFKVFKVYKESDLWNSVRICEFSDVSYVPEFIFYPIIQCEDRAEEYEYDDII